VRGLAAAAGEAGGDGAEVTEEHVEVVTYAAAIDVAKGSGMVCTRVPGSRAGRKKLYQTSLTIGKTAPSRISQPSRPNSPRPASDSCRPPLRNEDTS